MALATETPVDIIIPMYDCRLSVDPVSNSMANDPRITAGIVTNAVSESFTL
ncbi:hypothetical protein D3C79_1045030 [compost metagenome]